MSEPETGRCASSEEANECERSALGEGPSYSPSSALLRVSITFLPR